MIKGSRIWFNFIRDQACGHPPQGWQTSLIHQFRPFSSTSGAPSGKPKVVVLGSGWSSIFFVKNLSPKQFDLTVVSPRNYFTFTPLLPKVLSGMVSPKTASEPMIEFVRRHFRADSEFIHATCVDVDTGSNTLTCAPVDQDAPKFSLHYDYLVIGVGARTNSFGIPGVEKYAYFLKEVEHAELVFQKVLDNFRMASMPFVPEEEKRRLLHFVVVGGGPTGAESTGELSLLVTKYLAKSYPDLAPFVSVSIVEGGQRLLPTLDPESSSYTAKLFHRNNVNTYFGKVVCEVKPESCILKELATGAKEEIRCGLVLWASGLKESELVSKLQKKWKMPENSRALVVDQYLRLHGTDNVFCLGDCCRLTPTKLADNVDAVLKQIGQPSLEALVKGRKALAREFPQLRDSKWKFKDEKFKNAVSEIRAKNEDPHASFVEVLKHIDSTYAPPFPTAQNAKQEAIYLAKAFNSGAAFVSAASSGDGAAAGARFRNNAFCEQWKGTLASLGGKKVVMNTPLLNKNGGLVPFLFWNLVYLAMFSSLRMRVSFLFDLLLSFSSSRHMANKQFKS